MPHEYYVWIANLDARDTVALASAALGLAGCVLALLWYRRAPGSSRIGNVRLTKFLSKIKYPLAWIVALGAALRLLNLGTQSLWYDEAFSALTAQRPLGDLITAVLGDCHPPAYYLLLWAWSRLWPFLGQPSDAWVRFPSMVMGTANTAILYLVARQFQRPRREALTAALLMAVLPFQLFYSQEARMYEMLLLAALVTLAGYATRRWALVIVGGTLALYTQSMGAFFLASLGLVALLFDRARLRPLIVCGLAVGALHAPWIVWGMAGQVGRMGGGHYWIPQVTPGSFAYVWHALLWGEASPTPVVFPGMAVSLGLACAAMIVGVRRRLYPLVGLMIGPPLLAVPASLLTIPVLLPRTFITATPALYILAAAVLWYPRGPRRALAAALSLLVAVALWGYYTDVTLQKWPNRAWAAEIAARYRPGDAVFYIPQSLPFAWYLPPDIPQYLLPQDDAAPNAGFNLTNRTAVALGLKLARPRDLAPLGYRRAFVVYGRSPASGSYQDDTWRLMVGEWPTLWQYDFVEERDYLYATIALLDLE